MCLNVVQERLDSGAKLSLQNVSKSYQPHDRDLELTSERNYAKIAC